MSLPVPRHYQNRPARAWFLAPHFRGYARLGTGQYLLNNSAAGEEAELVISVATDEEKVGRVVGDERGNVPGNLIQPDVIAVRIAFTTVAGLDALENQLRKLRDEHFPLAASPSPAPAQHADDIAVDAFATDMKAKMAKQRDKGYSGWESAACDDKYLADQLFRHAQKGDPVDVGNFAMMLHQRNVGDIDIGKCALRIAALDFAKRVASMWIPEVAPAQQQEPSLKDSLAEALHYPGCWDTAAYPALSDALSAVYDHFKCSECAAPGASIGDKQ